MANAVFLAVELVGGFAFGSLALLADAAHMVSDVTALALAYVAVRIALRPPTDRHTYGFGRTEVLAALANGVLLILSAIAITIEAVVRLQNPACDRRRGGDRRRVLGPGRQPRAARWWCRDTRITA